MNALANDIFPKRLAALRESKGVSRQIVADELGISRASLEYYEKGQRVPDIVVLSRIADYFNVSADYLLGRTDIKSANPDIKMFHTLTGLSEDSIGYLCSNKTQLEKNTLDALFSEMGFRLFGIGFNFVSMYKTRAFRKAALKQFAAENNLTITDGMMFEMEENTFKEAVGEEQYLSWYTKWNDYCKEQAELFGINEPSCDFRYQEYLLKEETNNLFSDAFLSFCDTPIAEYYDNYYSRLFDLKGDDEAILALNMELYSFVDSIFERKGGD